MISENLQLKIKEIKENDKEFSLTPRQLINDLGCEKRTSGNISYINKFLQDNLLETYPDYINAWIDGTIILRHKKKAKSKSGADPIQRIKILPAANKEPITIKRDASIKEAVTLMMLNNFSQLPVVSGTKTPVGFISWETIGHGLTNGTTSEKVSDFMSKDIEVLDYETPLLEAIAIIIKKEFAIVQKSDKSICGIITIVDISEQYLTMTEPFLLLEQIENHIRRILNGKFLVEELNAFCKIGDTERNIENIDKLNFGDYIIIIEKPEHWDRLNLTVDRPHFIKQLHKVREIRNDIMHFNPEGISEEHKKDLNLMARFLMKIIKYLKE